MTTQEKIADATNWILHQPVEVQKKAIEQLLEHAIESEWVGVWKLEDRQQLASESGKPLSEYEAPYFRTCGDPLGK